MFLFKTIITSFYLRTLLIGMIFQFFTNLTIAQTECTYENFNKLIGTWTQVGRQDSTMALEKWVYTEDSLLQGEGLMLTDGKEELMERLSILCDSAGCAYIADVEHNNLPVHFECKECLPDHFLFVNEGHDFLTHIEYTFNAGGDSLKAEVYNSERRSVFKFVRSAEN